MAPTRPSPSCLHADLWRLRDAGELGDLALDELLDDGAAAIVEWGERFGVATGRDHVVVSFEVLDEATRELTVDLAGSSIDAGALDALER